MNVGWQGTQEAGYQLAQAAAGERQKMLDQIPISSNTNSLGKEATASMPENSNGSSPTPASQAEMVPSSSTSKSRESESPSLRGDRILRWQVEIGTNAHPSNDEQFGEDLFRKLEIAFGSNIKITRLRTKENS